MTAGVDLAFLVARLGGELRGNPRLVIRRIAPLESAGEGDLTFLANSRYRRQLENTLASAVILSPDDASATNVSRIVVGDPYLYFAKVSRLLNPARSAVPGIHPSAIVAPAAIVSPLAEISPHVVIEANAVVQDGVILGAGCYVGENASIGAESLLHPHVTVHSGCRIGLRNVIHSGSVIGADGFGMARENGHWLKIPQTGKVIIGNDVEVGANTTIDRGALDDTIIGDGVKLDNQIQIAHNVRIGDHCALAGCVGIAGSARIGLRCTIGGGAIIVGHIEIADDVHISAATLVTKSIRKPGTYGGAFPFLEQGHWRKSAALLRNIEAMHKRLTILEKALGQARGRVWGGNDGKND